MLLKEFFGRAIKVGKKMGLERGDDNNLLNNLFYFVIDHDKLYKEYFLPIAKKIKNEDLSKENCIVEFMPMVKKGCMEYYKANKMKGALSKCFPKELREELCEKLHDHYREGLLKNEYKI